MNPDPQEDAFSVLAENLVEEILLRLPAESLVRCKGVQKSWRGLINDRLFAKRHLEATIDNRKSSSSATLLLDCSYRECPIQINPSEQAVSNSKQAIRMVTISRPSPSDGDDDHLCCVVDEPSFAQFVKAKMAVEDLDSFSSVTLSHCNGIVCAVHNRNGGNGKVVVCNPVTKEFECFSQPNFELRFGLAGHGFGYDSKNDDYKYVRITWSIRKFSVSVSGDLVIKLAYKAHLYTMGSDTLREIKIDEDIESLALCSKGVYFNDVYYWRSLPVSGTNAIVLALDLSTEKFHSIPLPNHVCDSILEDNKWKTLTLWKESVVLFNLIKGSPCTTLFEMWVLVDKFGGVDGDASWTKHLTIGPLENVRKPLEFWKDDELLLESKNGKIVSYNLHTTKVRTIPTGLEVSPFSFHVVTYVNSLVSMKRQNMLNR